MYDAIENSEPIDIDDINFAEDDLSNFDFRANASAPVSNILNNINREELKNENKA
jgi:hypothetical protein